MLWIRFAPLNRPQFLPGWYYVWSHKPVLEQWCLISQTQYIQCPLWCRWHISFIRRAMALVGSFRRLQSAVLQFNGLNQRFPPLVISSRSKWFQTNFLFSFQICMESNKHSHLLGYLYFPCGPFLLQRRRCRSGVPIAVIYVWNYTSPAPLYVLIIQTIWHLPFII